MTCELSDVTMSTTCITSSVLIKLFACYLISLGLTPAYDNSIKTRLEDITSQFTQQSGQITQTIRDAILANDLQSEH